MHGIRNELELGSNKWHGPDISFNSAVCNSLAKDPTEISSTDVLLRETVKRTLAHVQYRGVNQVLYYMKFTYKSCLNLTLIAGKLPQTQNHQREKCT